MAATSLIELGGVILGLAIPGAPGEPRRTLDPLYLLAGLAFGEGGLLDLGATASFVETGSEIWTDHVLLFLVGLEYSASELLAALRELDPCGGVEPGVDVPTRGGNHVS